MSAILQSSYQNVAITERWLVGITSARTGRPKMWKLWSADPNEKCVLLSATRTSLSFELRLEMVCFTGYRIIILVRSTPSDKRVLSTYAYAQSIVNQYDMVGNLRLTATSLSDRTYSCDLVASFVPERRPDGSRPVEPLGAPEKFELLPGKTVSEPLYIECGQSAYWPIMCSECHELADNYKVISDGRDQLLYEPLCFGHDPRFQMGDEKRKELAQKLAALGPAHDGGQCTHCGAGGE